MLDLETLGTGSKACIIQIGACYFDRETGEIGQTIRINVDARSSVREGGQIDADTVYWWLSQSKEAINSMTAPPLVDIKTAMNDLNAFLADATHIWSHATFDYVIITNVFKMLNIKPLFRYTAARDIRTLVDLSKVTVNKKDSSRQGVHHDALDDCIYQVRYCVEAFKVLKANRDSGSILSKVKKLL